MPSAGLRQCCAQGAELTAGLILLAVHFCHFVLLAQMCFMVVFFFIPSALQPCFSRAFPAFRSLPGSLFSPDPMTSRLSWLNRVWCVQGSGLIRILFLSWRSPQLGVAFERYQCVWCPTIHLTDGIPHLGWLPWAIPQPGPPTPCSMGKPHSHPFVPAVGPAVARSISCIPALLWDVIPCHRNTMRLQ